LTQPIVFFARLEHHWNARIRIGPSGKKSFVGLQAGAVSPVMA
jgi:hypothetical protein